MAASNTSIRKVRDRCAAIDIGAEEHWTCVDPGLAEKHIRRFGAFTADLEELRDWLLSLGVTSVAMEATGVYWRELYAVLEAAGIEVLLADPRRTRNPRGRKTDMQDCQWIWELHAHGLLDGAYVPPEMVQELRTYLRHRRTHVDAAGVSLKEMQRAYSLMNIKLQHVIADLGGVSGMAITEAIVKGQRDPAILAKLRDRRCQTPEATVIKALRGNWKKAHLFLLKQALADYQHHREAIARCDAEIEHVLAAMPQRRQDGDGDDFARKRPTGKNDFAFDAQQHVYRVTGVDLAAIDGIGPNAALSLIGEIGTDLTAWPTSKAFCCWLGLCPNPKRSGGKLLGNLPTTANRASQIIREAAMGLRGNKLNPLSKQYNKIAIRRGSGKALRAIAHRLARIIYALFTKRTAYDRDALEPKVTQKKKASMIARLQAQAAALGYVLSQPPKPA